VVFEKISDRGVFWFSEAETPSFRVLKMAKRGGSKII
jgi:hypothetical protein